MKLIKRIIFGLLIVIALLLIIAIFVEKEYTVQREVIINKPKTEVFDYIKFLKNQDNYSKWNKLDNNMKKTYKGTDAQVGFTYRWEGNEDVGVGEQEILAIHEGKQIDFDLRFIEPIKSHSKASMGTESISENETKVFWRIDGKMNYPFNLFLLTMNADEMIGGDLEEGLKNLKNVLEK